MFYCQGNNQFPWQPAPWPSCVSLSDSSCSRRPSRAPRARGSRPVGRVQPGVGGRGRPIGQAQCQVGPQCLWPCSPEDRVRVVIY